MNTCKSGRLVLAGPEQLLCAARPSVLPLSMVVAGIILASNPVRSLAQSVAAEPTEVLQEIVVTATRREEAASKVPISLSVVSEQDIDKQGFRSLDDVARVTPGVQFDAGTGNIVIRGIDGTSIGAGTVGIYIDDTPIQIRTFGTASANAVQRLFDIDRLEILRGPQGTLFGSGSEGGTVRYITPQPNLHDLSVYARGEVSGTQDGGLGGEAGVAIGGPVIDDKVGFRVSAWHSHTSGYVDRVGDVDPYALLASNENWVDTNIVRAALTIKPVPELTITPSVLYQSTYTNGSSGFIVGLSDPGRGIYHSNSPTKEYDWDQYFLPALHAQYSAGFADVIYNGSYFDRGQYGNNDYTRFFSDLFGLSTPTGPNFGPLPGYDAHTDAINTQRNVTQELRLQSADPKARVSWVAGFFYAHQSQNNRELTHDPQYYDFNAEVLGAPATAPLVPPDFSYMGWDTSVDVQQALFAQLDFHLTDKLTLTLGERFSRFQLSFDVTQNGPYAGGLVERGGHTNENASTPKFGLSYQANDRNLFYATVSKGFRPGAVADPVPADTCAQDLNALGYTNAPASFNSDSVWSYEIGAKNALADGRVRLATSVYRIEWSHIQTAIYLPTCGFTLDTNLAKAQSTGFDFQADFGLAPGLTAGVLVGRTNARYSQTVFAPPVNGTQSTIVSDGDTLGAPPWTATATLDWNFHLAKHDAYFRGDYSYIRRNNDLLPAQDPTSTSYDPATYSVPTSRYVTARAGIVLKGLDISLFVNNLTNESVLLTDTHTRQGSPMFLGTVYPPRTGGVTLVYRY